MITDFLGNSPRIKILEFLIWNRDKDHSISDIILGANVKYRNLVIILEDLIKKDMIYISRKVGKSNLYKVNEFNPYIESLIFASDLKRKEETKP